MLIRQAHWILVACVGLTSTLLLGCERDGSSSQQSAGAVQALNPCFDQWWREPMAGSCACTGRPECDASDCQALTVLRLGRDGSYAAGVITTSEKTGTVGVIGSLSSGTFVAEADAIRFAPTTGRPHSISEAECSAERLVLNRVINVPVDKSLSTNIEGMLADNSRREP